MSRRTIQFTDGDVGCQCHNVFIAKESERFCSKGFEPAIAQLNINEPGDSTWAFCQLSRHNAQRLRDFLTILLETE